MSNMTQFEKLCFHFKPLKICFCFLIPGKHKRICGEKKKLSNFRNSGWSRKVAWTDYFNLERKLIIDLRHTPKFWNSWHFQCVLEKLRSIVQHAKSKLGFLRKNFLVSQTESLFSPRNLVLPWPNNQQSYHAIHATVHLQWCFNFNSTFCWTLDFWVSKFFSTSFNYPPQKWHLTGPVRSHGLIKL